MNKTFVRAVLTPGIVLLIFLATGCGKKKLPPQMDADVARASLTAALDAWKEGRKPETLRDRTPPVDFRDVQWEKGTRLNSYLVKTEERSGQSVRFTVQLTVGQKEGQSRERVVAFNVDAGNTVVIRPDF